MLSPPPAPSNSPAGLLPASTPVWVGMLCLAWIVPGLVGHEPWKPIEAPTFGMIYGMLRDGQWLIPHLAGEPIYDQPPLLLWVCAVFAKLLGSLMPMHDAARCGVLVFVATIVGEIVFSARRLFGKAAMLPALLLLLGCIGFFPEAHQIVPDLTAIAGFAMGLHALAMMGDRPKLGGALLGFGAAVVFLGADPLYALTLLAIALMLPVLFVNWRTRQVAVGMGTSMLLVLPLCLLWIIAVHADAMQVWTLVTLHLHIPAGKQMAIAVWAQIRVLSWHTWPLWPMAAWALWSGRNSLGSNRGLQIPLVMLSLLLLVFLFDNQPDDTHRLPVIVPLCLLGSQGLLTLRRGAAHALLWFSIMFFLLFVLVGWYYWVGMDLGYPASLHRHVMRLQPGYRVEFPYPRAALALALALGWVWILITMRRSPERPMLAWTAGSTMLWGTFLALFGNYMDTGRSYRGLVQEIHSAIPSQTRCVGSAGLGVSQRALLHYFGNVITERTENAQARRDCTAMLIQTTRDKPRDLGPEWHLAFSGGRLGDRTEHYQLFTRHP